MANIDTQLEENLKALGLTYVLHDNNNWTRDNVPAEDADEITVYSHDEICTFYTYKLPKGKLVDTDWIMNKWNKSTDSTYQSFTENFKSILDAKGYKNSINVYPTTYGIGIFVMLGARDSITRIHKDVMSVLDENNIDYKTTTSEAGWVFQFRISKSQENIEKLKLIQNA